VQIHGIVHFPRSASILAVFVPGSVTPERTRTASMDDPAEQDGPASLDALAALANSGGERWHAAPGATSGERTLVLDDGTGDVELRLRADNGRLAAALFVRDAEVDRFDRPAAGATPGEAGAAFREWLNAAVRAHASGSPEDAGRGKSRFIVSFAADQLARLRARAEREGVPIAEVVRRAVGAYLASDSPAGSGPPLD
jgi:hypothetical protein